MGRPRSILGSEGCATGSERLTWRRGWRCVALIGAMLLLLLQGRTTLFRLGAWPGLGWLARPPEFGRAPLAGSTDQLGRRLAVYGLQADAAGVTLWCAISGAGIGALGTPEIRLAIAPPGGAAPSGESLSGPGATRAERGSRRWLGQVRWPPILADQAQVLVLARLGSAAWQVAVPVQRSGPAPRTYWLGRRALAADAALIVDQVVAAPEYTAVYYRYQPDPVGRAPVGPFLSSGDRVLARQPQRLSAPGEVVFDPLPAGARAATLTLRLGSGEQRLDIPIQAAPPLPVPAWGAVRSGGVLFERRDPAEYAVLLQVTLAGGARLGGWELLPAGGGHFAPGAVSETIQPVAAGDLHTLHLVFPAGAGDQALTLRTHVELPPAALAVSIDLP